MTFIIEKEHGWLKWVHGCINVSRLYSLRMIRVLLETAGNPSTSLHSLPLTPSSFPPKYTFGAWRTDKWYEKIYLILRYCTCGREVIMFPISSLNVLLISKCVSFWLLKAWHLMDIERDLRIVHVLLFPLQHDAVVVTMKYHRLPQNRQDLSSATGLISFPFNTTPLNLNNFIYYFIFINKLNFLLYFYV